MKKFNISRVEIKENSVTAYDTCYNTTSPAETRYKAMMWAFKRLVPKLIKAWWELRKEKGFMIKKGGNW